MEPNESKGVGLHHNLAYDPNYPIGHHLHYQSLSKNLILPSNINEDEGNTSTSFCFNRSSLIPTSQNQIPIINVLSPNTSCHSNDTVLDGFKEHKTSIVAERKLRRMISNRESARRSRMRKKKQIEELQYHVNRLEASNRHLSEKLIYLLECNQQILQENSELKEKIASLQILLTDLVTAPNIRNVEDMIFCSNNRARAEDHPTTDHKI